MTALTVLHARREAIRNILDTNDRDTSGGSMPAALFNFYIGQLEAVNCALNRVLGKPVGERPPVVQSD